MELTQLYYFYITAKYEHMSKAASELNIAQPALSKSIHNLEKELDVTLFENKGRNIILTKWGKYLFQRIETPLFSLKNIKSDIEKLKNEKHITILSSAATIFISDAIIEFKKKHSDVTFSLYQSSCDNYDISVTTSLDINSHQFKEKLYLVTGEKLNHQINEKKDIESYPLITFTSFKMLRNIIDEVLNKENIKSKIAFECDNISSLENLIINNNGIGFYPEFTWGKLPKNIYIQNISDLNVERGISLIKNNYPINNQEIIDEFYTYLESCFKNKKVIKLEK